MSRARPWVTEDGETTWFDYHAPIATSQQLELLADLEDSDLEDLIDEGLSQRQVLFRLHRLSNLVPEDVLKKRRDRARFAREQPVCRICPTLDLPCEGRITRHHFVPRWLMRELSTYNLYAAKSKCTIPVCVGRHRDLHYRQSELEKSIVPYLLPEEKEFAKMLLEELQQERPLLFATGPDSLTVPLDGYEHQLFEDFRIGRFDITQEETVGS